MPRVSATSMKMIGSSGSCGWKKAKQRRSACSRRRRSGQPCDRVHRLVVDQLLEHERRGVPVDALEAQEAAVEPRAQQVEQVVVEQRASAGCSSSFFSSTPRISHQRGGAARRHVEAAEQLLARRLGGLLQPRCRLSVDGVGLVGRRGGLERRLGRANSRAPARRRTARGRRRRAPAARSAPRARARCWRTRRARRAARRRATPARCDRRSTAPAAAMPPQEPEDVHAAAAVVRLAHQARGFVAGDALEVVAVLEQHAERVVHRLRVEHDAVERRQAVGPVDGLGHARQLVTDPPCAAAARTPPPRATAPSAAFGALRRRISSSRFASG